MDITVGLHLTLIHFIQPRTTLLYVPGFHCASSLISSLHLWYCLFAAKAATKSQRNNNDSIFTTFTSLRQINLSSYLLLYNCYNSRITHSAKHFVPFLHFVSLLHSFNLHLCYFLFAAKAATNTKWIAILCAAKAAKKLSGASLSIGTAFWRWRSVAHGVWHVVVCAVCCSLLRGMWRSVVHYIFPDFFLLASAFLPLRGCAIP